MIDSNTYRTCHLRLAILTESRSYIARRLFEFGDVQLLVLENTDRMLGGHFSARSNVASLSRMCKLIVTSLV